MTTDGNAKRTHETLLRKILHPRKVEVVTKEDKDLTNSVRNFSG